MTITTAEELEDLLLELNEQGHDAYLLVVDSRPHPALAWLREVGGEDVVAGVTIGEPGLKDFAGLRRNQPLDYLTYPVTVLYRPDQQAQPTVKPDVKAIEWALSSEDHRDPAAPYDYSDMIRAILALLPGRTEAEVKAEALREAADAYSALPEGERTYFPAIHANWLRARADRIGAQAGDPDGLD